MHGRLHVVAFVGLAGVLCATLSAEAGRYQRRPRHYTSVVIMPRGLYVGAGVAGTRILQQQGGDELLGDGGGLTLFTGLRLNRSLAIELGWAGTLHNPEKVATPFGDDVDYLVLNAITGDAKIYLGSDSPSFEPFLQGGVGAYFLDSTYFGTQSIGSGFQLGGGFDFTAGSNVGLGLRALYRGMAMRPPDADADDTFISAVSVEANVSLRF